MKQSLKLNYEAKLNNLPYFLIGNKLYKLLLFFILTTVSIEDVKCLQFIFSKGILFTGDIIPFLYCIDIESVLDSYVLIEFLLI